MKRIFITAVALLTTTFCVEAQQKGDRFFGGNIGLSTQTLISYGKSTTGIGFTFAPEVGYFVAKKFRIGATFQYALQHTDDGTQHSIFVGPTLAGYARICNGFHYSPEFSFGYGYSQYNDSKDGMNGFACSLEPVKFEFRPTDHFGMSVSLISFAYVYGNYRGEEAHSISFNISANPSIGLRYYF